VSIHENYGEKLGKEKGNLGVPIVEVFKEVGRIRGVEGVHILRERGK